MATGLKPTLWRTARALANVDRLNLLRLVSLAKGSKGVGELAAGGFREVARMARGEGLARQGRPQNGTGLKRFWCAPEQHGLHVSVRKPRALPDERRAVAIRFIQYPQCNSM